MFPILFAAVLGRAAHATFVWRLERGERVGVLDLLAGSTSLTSTVSSQLQLRMFSVFSVLLLVIWALSPIGGQASLRVMTIGSQTAPEASSFTYMVPAGNMSPLDSSDRETTFGIIDALFLSSLVAPFSDRTSSIDTWNNVKIPMVETYENTSTADDQGWFTTSNDSDVYSSLVGLPISGINGSFVNFGVSVEAQYLKLDCPVVQELETDEILTGANISSSDNSTVRWSANPADLEPRSFNYTWDYSWEHPGNYSYATFANCSITTTYVEADIRCNTSIQSTCRASRLRRSQRNNRPKAFTLLDAYVNSWAMFTNFFGDSIEGHPGYPTIVQNYLVNPTNPLDGREGTEGWLAGNTADSPSNEVYAIRLGQLMNSYWTLMNGIHAIPGGMTPKTAFMEGTDVSDTDGMLANSSTVIGTRSTDTTVIQCHPGWVVALSVASMSLIIAVVYRLIIRHFFTRGPDLMVNISSLAARDNPYMPLPGGETFVNTNARTRFLRDMKVQFGDVEGERDVGKLAIGSYSRVDGIKRVRKGRLYM